MFEIIFSVTLNITFKLLHFVLCLFVFCIEHSQVQL